MNTFEITSPMTSLTKGSCMMHHHTVHSESLTRYEKRFLEVSHSNCLCHWVLKGHLCSLLKWGLLTVRLGWDITRWSVLWDELGLIALLLFSAGSRTTFTQTEQKTKKQKLSWRTISLSFVWLDGKTNERTSASARCTDDRQAKAITS